MSITIYVANLPPSLSDEQIEALFREYGDVQSIKLIKDKDSGQRLGYGFVDMDEEAAKEAMFALNGKEMDGNTLQVNHARGRSESR